MKEELFVIGYPRSGNVWVTRLLGRILDSEISSGKPEPSVADEGSGRQGKYVIRQTHSRKPVNGKVVFVYRDPRDVAVSAMRYWQKKSLDDLFSGDALRVMSEEVDRGWAGFMHLWLEKYGVDAITSYETLHINPIIEMEEVIENIGESVDHQKIAEAIEAERFDKRKSLIQNSAGDAYPYGQEIQLRHMRKGVVGDWKNYFTRKHAKMVNKHWWCWLEKLGYEDDENWWEKVKE